MDDFDAYIKRTATWLHKGAPVDECESTIRALAAEAEKRGMLRSAEICRKEGEKYAARVLHGYERVLEDCAQAIEKEANK